MKVIKRKVLVDFWETYPQARSPLEHWYHLTRQGEWQSSTHVKQVFGNAVDPIGHSRAVFNIKGNDFRLIAEINCRRQAVLIRFLDTHEEYDRVDAKTVKRY